MCSLQEVHEFLDLSPQPPTLVGRLFVLGLKEGTWQNVQQCPLKVGSYYFLCSIKREQNVNNSIIFFVLTQQGAEIQLRNYKIKMPCLGSQLFLKILIMISFLNQKLNCGIVEVFFDLPAIFSAISLPSILPQNI